MGYAKSLKLSINELNELHLRFAKEPNESDRDKLILYHAPLVNYVAKRSGMKWDEDMMQEGLIGLIRAVDSFKPEKGFKFSSYAVIRIRGAVIDAWRSGASKRHHAKNIKWRPLALDDTSEKYITDNGGGELEIIENIENSKRSELLNKYKRIKNIKKLKRAIDVHKILCERKR